MNKQLTIVIRVVEWLYIAVYTLYFLLIGYQLLVARPVTPESTVPVLSVTQLQADATALEDRVVLVSGSQYTASTGGAFGKSEPFNP